MKKRSKVLSILCSVTTFACMFGTNSTSAMDDGRGSKGKMMQEIEECKKRIEEQEKKLKKLKELEASDQSVSEPERILLEEAQKRDEAEKKLNEVVEKRIAESKTKVAQVKGEKDLTRSSLGRVEAQVAQVAEEKRKETENLEEMDQVPELIKKEKICDELVNVGDARAKAKEELEAARRKVLSARVQETRANEGSLRLSSRGAQAIKAVRTREAAKKKVEEAEKKFKEAEKKFKEAVKAEKETEARMLERLKNLKAEKMKRLAANKKEREEIVKRILEATRKKAVADEKVKKSKEAISAMEKVLGSLEVCGNKRQEENVRELLSETKKLLRAASEESSAEGKKIRAEEEKTLSLMKELSKEVEALEGSQREVTELLKSAKEEEKAAQESLRLSKSARSLRVSRKVAQKKEEEGREKLEKSQRKVELAESLLKEINGMVEEVNECEVQGQKALEAAKNKRVPSPLKRPTGDTSDTDGCNNPTIREIEDEIKTVEDVKTNLELEGIKVTSISNLGDKFGISNSFEKEASRLATELVKLDILRKDLEIVKNMEQSIAGTCKVLRDVSGESKSPELVERTHSYTTEVLNRARRIVTALSTYKDDYKLGIGEDIIIRVISGKNRDIRSLISSGCNVNCPEMWTAGFLKSLESYGEKKIDKESLISMVDEIMNNTEGVKNVAFRALIAFARCVWRSNGSLTEPVNGLSFEEVVSTYIKLAKIADNYLYQDIIEAARVARAARVTYRFFRAENINTNGVPNINRGIIQMVEDEYRNVSRG